MTVDQARRMSVESLPGKDIEAQLDTDKVALFVRRELLPADTLDKTQVCVRTTVLARITRTTADVWNGFDSTTKSLQDLLTFATRYPCSIRARRLLSSREEGLGKRIEVISEGLAKTRLDHKVDQSRFLFTLDDGNLQHILQKWSDLRNRVGLGIHVLFGLDYLQEGFYENRLFNAASVAEAMHRALFPDSKGIDPARYQRIRADLEAAIADPNDLSWVKNRLPNEPGFKQRIRELAGVPDQAAVIDLLGDVDSWTKWLGNARNSLAHLNSGDFERIPTPTRFLLARITVALMHLVLLQEMGIAPEIQRRVVRNVYGGLARSLKEAVSS